MQRERGEAPTAAMGAVTEGAAAEALVQQLGEAEQRARGDGVAAEDDRDDGDRHAACCVLRRRALQVRLALHSLDSRWLDESNRADHNAISSRS